MLKIHCCSKKFSAAARPAGPRPFWPPSRLGPTADRALPPWFGRPPNRLGPTEPPRLGKRGTCRPTDRTWCEALSLLFSSRVPFGSISMFNVFLVAVILKINFFIIQAKISKIWIYGSGKNTLKYFILKFEPLILKWDIEILKKFSGKIIKMRKIEISKIWRFFKILLEI